MGKVYTSLFLILWYIILTWANLADANWPTRIVAFLVSFPLILFCLYLIWFDSKLPKDQQFRYYNSRFGKNGRKRPS